MWKVKKTTKQFVSDAHSVHGNCYDYSLVNYTNTRTKVAIVCSQHGMFLQRPYNHLNGQGCPACKPYKVSQRLRFTKEQFVTRATSIHGSTYNYDNFVYKNAHIKGAIICLVHGTFSQTPKDHIYNQAGCPECKKQNLKGSYTETYFQTNKNKQNIQGYLYGVKLTDKDDTPFIKVGITSQPLYYRLSQYGMYETLFVKHLLLYDAFKLERTILTVFETERYIPKRHFAGHSECVVYNQETLKQILVLVDKTV